MKIWTHFQAIHCECFSCSFCDTEWISRRSIHRWTFEGFYLQWETASKAAYNPYCTIVIRHSMSRPRFLNWFFLFLDKCNFFSVEKRHLYDRSVVCVTEVRRVCARANLEIPLSVHFTSENSATTTVFLFTSPRFFLASTPCRKLRKSLLFGSVLFGGTVPVELTTRRSFCNCYYL